MASHYRLFYKAKLVGGKTSPLVKGEFTIDEAMARVLAGTGLAFDITSSNVILIRQENDPSLPQKITTPPSAPQSTSGLRDTVDVTNEEKPGTQRELHPRAALADEEDASSATLQEITVTASRREQVLESVPYSLSVVSVEQLNQSGVSDLMSLASYVPGLSMYETGARFSASVAPVIRGINATAAPQGGFRSFEQNSVGIYIDNSPVDGYFQLDDLQRIEVLRGPQGTLYGAGALGGALRLIPNAPDPSTFAASVEAGGHRFYNSSGTGYTLKSMINIPLADTVAVRASARYQYDPGWIDVYGLLKRTNNGPNGIPILADPSDPTDSPGIYSSREGWNFQRTFTGHIAGLWKPNETFSATLALLHSNVQGNGGPSVNLSFPGGPSPFDPRINLPAGGKYQEFSQIEQPFSRYTNLTSLDLAYDVGFATLSSTSSYYTTTGSVQQDQTYHLAYDSVGFAYYAGTPRNPRFVYDSFFADQQRTFTEEVRLVSDSKRQNPVDYVFGAFYEKQTSTGAWTIFDPGSPERAALYGETILAAPGDLTFQQIDTQHFTDKSVFGELTWHFAKHGQITLGVRHFTQDFTDAQSYVDYTYPVNVPAVPHNAPASKTVGKANLSYEYAYHQYAYALWSQGFRRGGANSVPLTGIFRESPLLAMYQPDSTNNYEMGLKGRFDSGLSYSVDVFYIKWDKPQIASSLPDGNLAVYNANSAVSKGLEFETSGPLGLRGFSYATGFSYVDAKLSSSFSLPANNGQNMIVDGELYGTDGEQMPGSPRISVNAALNYARPLAQNYDLALSVNGVYRSAISMTLAPPIQKSSSYEIMNLSATVNHKQWHYGAYVTNLLNKQEIMQPSQLAAVGRNYFPLAYDYVVNPPRVIGIRAGYTF
ncbi:MAG: TonB-dependent receptor plug domain-containing protein [Proteobacteria bacterium]|nr:TonB-dependent receptor plug domain-containing protein [Pseudomonadota bacterium]